MAHRALGIGILGFGTFGMFAARELSQLAGAELRCIAGTQRDAAAKGTERLGLPQITGVQGMLAMPEIDLVYIATPASMHHEQARQAVRAGKNVIVHGPLALTMDHAHEIVGLARDKGLTVTTSETHRYNPLFAQVKRLVESKVLGKVLHGYFENQSRDEERLAPEQWRDEKTETGGLFLEHATPFFDMFSGWLGKGSVESAGLVLRTGTESEEQVYCTARYGAVPVSYHHGFSHTGGQEARLVFERGELTLRDAIPSHAVIRTALDGKPLLDIFPNARIDVEIQKAEPERLIRTSHKGEAHQRTTVTSKPHAAANIHGDLLRALVADQLAHVANAAHVRSLNEEDARDALRMAVAATRLAVGSASSK